MRSMVVKCDRCYDTSMMMRFGDGETRSMMIQINDIGMRSMIRCGDGAIRYDRFDANDDGAMRANDTMRLHRGRRFDANK